MVQEASPTASVSSPVLPVLAGLLAIMIFVFDTFVIVPDAVATLYVFVVLLSVNFLQWRGVLLVSLGCAALAVLSYSLQHGASYTGDSLVRLLVSLAAVGVTTFLASRHQTAAAVLHERARLLDLTHDTIFVRDMNDVITYWNRGAEALYGWRSDEALGKVSHQLMSTVFPEPLDEIMAKLLRAERWEGELVHTKRDGSQAIVASRWSVQRDKQRRPIAILETNNDISERNRAEQVLRRQANLLEQTHDAVLVWEFPGTITYWNRGAEQLYGFSRGEAVGRLSHDLLQTEHPLPAELFEKLIEQHGTWAGELTQTTRGGEKVVVDSRHVLLREADGRRFVLETNHDITKRKEAEMELQRAQADLAHMARVTTLGEFTASIAHEVNQPLAAIVTNGEVSLRWLDREVPDLAEVREAVDAMISNGRRASDIILRLRALTKKTLPDKVALDINDIIKEVIPLVKREMLGHRVSLRLDLAPTLPMVLCDRVQLQQVMINLLANAIEAMTAVSDRPRELVVRSQQDDTGQVLIAVQDSGTGFDPQKANQLFNAFFTTKPSGMGMGLTICRSIIENHGGTLSASRNAGHGATFQFTLRSHQEARS